MGKTSRTKGAAGEREFARLVRTHGFDCERTGRNGRTSEDVTHSIPGLHVEVKRDERLSVDAMVRQAERDAADGLVPVVAFRRNRQPWRIVVDADEYLRLKALERDTLGDACACLTTEGQFRPCPPSLCERRDHAHLRVAA